MYEGILADRMKRLGTESAFAILARANELEAEGKSIVHLEVGQPDFKTPRHIIEAAYKAMNDGFTAYTPAPGLPVLREAIADYAQVKKGVKTNMKEIVVVPGGKPIMFFTMLALIQEGDEVIYPNPGFPIYESVIEFTGGRAVPMPMLAENGFALDLEALEKSINDRTKLLIINNPSNPLGKLYSKQEIDGIAEVLKRHPKLMLLSDEIYDRIVFSDEKPVSLASYPELKDRVIVLDGFSKSYAMTGWRIGFGIMNEELAEHVSRLMVNSNSCTAAFTQMAALEALTGPQDSVEEMRLAFLERRNWLVPALNDIKGMSCCMPEGAFYAFPSIADFDISSKEFCTRLMEEVGVAAAWGTSFGRFGEGCIRLSFANSLENLKTAVSRIEKFTRSL